MGPGVRDYWLSKLFFDLQNPAAAAEYRSDPEKVLGRYPVTEEVKQKLRSNDVPFLANRTNPYLLRYFFFAAGMKDEEFIRRLRDG